MTRSSRSSRNKPLWLIVVLAVIGWAYNRFAPQPTRERRTTSTRRTTTKPRPTPRPSTTMAEGGKMFRDTVVRVSDGDTVKLASQGSVRLIGVDCPEKAQAVGMDAKEFDARREKRGLFQTIGDVPDAATFRRNKRSTS